MDRWMMLACVVVVAGAAACVSDSGMTDGGSSDAGDSDTQQGVDAGTDGNASNPCILGTSKLGACTLGP